MALTLLCMAVIGSGAEASLSDVDRWMSDVYTFARQFELPLPPAGAKEILVAKVSSAPEGGTPAPCFVLAFHLRTWASGYDLFLGAHREHWEYVHGISFDFDADKIDPLGNALDMIFGRPKENPNTAGAIALYARGRRAEAAKIFQLSISGSWQGKPQPPKLRMLHLAWSDAFHYWTRASLSPSTDKQRALEKLRLLQRTRPIPAGHHSTLDPWPVTVQDVISSVESFLKSPPRSIQEKLLRRVIEEEREVWTGFERLPKEAAFWDLAAEGFAAVPVLIRALGDDSITNTWGSPSPAGPGTTMRVGFLAREILMAYGCPKLGYRTYSGRPRDSKDLVIAERWWNAVKDTDEKEHFAHLLRSDRENRIAEHVLNARFAWGRPAANPPQ